MNYKLSIDSMYVIYRDKFTDTTRQVVSDQRVLDLGTLFRQNVVITEFLTRRDVQRAEHYYQLNTRDNRGRPAKVVDIPQSARPVPEGKQLGVCYPLLRRNEPGRLVRAQRAKTEALPKVKLTTASPWRPSINKPDTIATTVSQSLHQRVNTEHMPSATHTKSSRKITMTNTETERPLLLDKQPQDETVSSTVLVARDVRSQRKSSGRKLRQPLGRQATPTGPPDRARLVEAGREYVTASAPPPQTLRADWLEEYFTAAHTVDRGKYEDKFPLGLKHFKKSHVIFQVKRDWLNKRFKAWSHWRRLRDGILLGEVAGEKKVNPDDAGQSPGVQVLDTDTATKSDDITTYD